jgi:iron complex transport system permease protein
VWFALVGAALASVVVYGLSSLGRRAATPLKLALAGTAVAALLSSLTWTILLLDVTSLNQFRFWMVGAIASRDD